jgi:hypothetical protein
MSVVWGLGGEKSRSRFSNTYGMGIPRRPQFKLHRSSRYDVGCDVRRLAGDWDESFIYRLW